MERRVANPTPHGTHLSSAAGKPAVHDLNRKHPGTHNSSGIKMEKEYHWVKD